MLRRLFFGGLHLNKGVLARFRHGLLHLSWSRNSCWRHIREAATEPGLGNAVMIGRNPLRFAGTRPFAGAVVCGAGTAVGVPILRWRRRNRGSERHNGTVKWFNERRGYGFIAQENGDDVFVHYREIRGEGFKTLTEGQQVEFGLVTRDKGPAAEDVVPTD